MDELKLNQLLAQLGAYSTAGNITNNAMGMQSLLCHQQLQHMLAHQPAQQMLYEQVIRSQNLQALQAQLLVLQQQRTMSSALAETQQDPSDHLHLESLAAATHDETNAKRNMTQADAVCANAMLTRAKRRRSAIEYMKAPDSEAEIDAESEGEDSEKKRLQKNKKEKQRRIEMNEEIYKIGDLLGLKHARSVERIRILKKAVQVLTALNLTDILNMDDDNENSSISQASG